jgi:alkanesulfonate monooxygenase SsuD/methylene tetrahydromethanopterin reductase-like flavin-dependent oxidoreductase (luciferase family)
VADRIVQLDYQTRGRAMFGFGPGLLPSDAMMLGIDPETQRDRMPDAIDIITRLLAGEVITQESEWYRMREARLQLRPYSKPRPHLAIASAVTPYGGKLAGRYDLGMLCVAAGSPNGYDTLDYNWELACAEGRRKGESWIAPIIASRRRSILRRYARRRSRMYAPASRSGSLLIFGKSRGRRRDRHAEHRGDQRGRPRRYWHARRRAAGA